MRSRFKVFTVTLTIVLVAWLAAPARGEVSLAPAPASFFGEVAIGRLDEDRLLDAVARGSDTELVASFQGPARHFTRVRVPIPSFSGQLAIADVAGGARSDLLLVGPGATQVLPGRGNRTFGPPITVATPYGQRFPQLVAGGDVTGDGHADAVILVGEGPADAPWTVVVLSRGRAGAPTVTASIDLPAGAVFASRPALQLVDVDRDGAKEIVTGGSSGGVVLRSKDRYAPRGLLPGVPILSLAVADLNMDDAFDIVTVEDPVASGAGTVRVRLSGAGGRLGGPTGPAPAVRLPTQVATGDANGDGAPDILAISATEDGTRTPVAGLLIGDGAGGFQAAPQPGIALKPSYRQPRLLDMDADGRAEIVLGNSDTSNVVYMNDSAFAPRVCSRRRKAKGCTPQAPPRCTSPCSDTTPPRLDASAPRAASAGAPLTFTLGCSESCRLTLTQRIERRSAAGKLVRLDEIDVSTIDVVRPNLRVRSTTRLEREARDEVAAARRSGQSARLVAHVVATDYAGLTSASRDLAVELR